MNAPAGQDPLVVAMRAALADAAFAKAIQDRRKSLDNWQPQTTPVPAMQMPPSEPIGGHGARVIPRRLFDAALGEDFLLVGAAIHWMTLDNFRAFRLEYTLKRLDTLLGAVLPDAPDRELLVACAALYPLENPVFRDMLVPAVAQWPVGELADAKDLLHERAPAVPWRRLGATADPFWVYVPLDRESRDVGRALVACQNRGLLVLGQPVKPGRKAGLRTDRSQDIGREAEEAYKNGLNPHDDPIVVPLAQTYYPDKGLRLAKRNVRDRMRDAGFRADGTRVESLSDLSGLMDDIDPEPEDIPRDEPEIDPDDPRYEPEP